MWILTQNGKRILTTDGMDEINVADPAEGRTDFAVMLHRRMDGKPFALGFYKKRENAMFVLTQIMKVQTHFFSCQGGADLISGGFQPGYVVIPPKTFDMPQDMEASFKHDIRTGKERTA